MLRKRLVEGWNGFSGEVRVLRQASPRGIPFEYVMQPCEVKLNYRSRPWFTVQLEIGHNEIGDADECDLIGVPNVLADLFEYLAIPAPAALPMMKLEYQVAQKLHGVTAPGSKRAHDLFAGAEARHPEWGLPPRWRWARRPVSPRGAWRDFFKFTPLSVPPAFDKISGLTPRGSRVRDTVLVCSAGF